MVYPAVFPTEIMRVFANEIFDVIHVHHPMFAGPLGVRLGKKYNVPVIFTCHTRYEDYLHYIPALKTDEHSPAYKRKAVRWIQEKMVLKSMRSCAGSVGRHEADPKRIWNGKQICSISHWAGG